MANQVNPISNVTIAGSSSRQKSFQIFGTHSKRNSYRSWLDAAGASIAVQQKLMRHGDIRTTLNIYGDVVTDEMVKAQCKVAGLALNSRQAARSAS